MGLIKNFLETVADAFKLPPYQSGCTGDCVQGRNCTCEIENWPFPEPKQPPFPTNTKP